MPKLLLPNGLKPQKIWADKFPNRRADWFLHKFMGVVLCKKHGKTGMVLTCNHLSKFVWNFQPINDFVKRVEKDADDIDDKFKFDWIYTLCLTCDKKYQTVTIGEFPKYFLKPACGKCFLELSDLKSWN